MTYYCWKSATEGKSKIEEMYKTEESLACYMNLASYVNYKGTEIKRRCNFNGQLS